MHEVSPEKLAAEVTQSVYVHAVELSRAVGARIGKPRAPRIANEVKIVARYAQGDATDSSNEEITNAINSIIRVLSNTCYAPATPAARAIFDRKAGEPRTEVELTLLAARARLGIELGLDVPIRWLAALGGVSVKTARNLASSGQFTTQTEGEGQVCTAREAARWLATRGIVVKVRSRRVAAIPS